MTDDPEVASKWEEWLEGFELMVAAIRVTTEKDKRKMLFYYLDSATHKVIKRLDGVSPEDAADCYTSLRTALNSYFKPKLKRVYGMNMLQHVIQQQDESIDNYLLLVKEKVAAIEIEKLEKQGIIDLITLAHLVNNCKNKHVKHKAIRDNLSLADFMKTARAAERAEYQLTDMEASGTTVNVVSKGQKSQNPKNQQGKLVEGQRAAMTTDDQSQRQARRPKNAGNVEVPTHIKEIVPPQTRNATSVDSKGIT